MLSLAHRVYEPRDMPLTYVVFPGHRFFLYLSG